jgi:hypothetical protein
MLQKVVDGKQVIAMRKVAGVIVIIKHDAKIQQHIILISIVLGRTHGVRIKVAGIIGTRLHVMLLMLKWVVLGMLMNGILTVVGAKSQVAGTLMMERHATLL